MRDSVEACFSALRDIHASGAAVAETSYYGPLGVSLNDIAYRRRVPAVTGEGAR